MKKLFDRRMVGFESIVISLTFLSMQPVAAAVLPTVGGILLAAYGILVTGNVIDNKKKVENVQS